MEPYTQQTTNSQDTGMHHSSKLLIVSTLVLVVLAGILIGIRIKEKRAYEAYLRTPEGQLMLLRETSLPVTMSAEEQAAELKLLDKSSTPVKKSRDEQLQEMQKLEQQQ